MRLPHQPCQCETPRIRIASGSVARFHKSLDCPQCYHAATNSDLNRAWGGDGRVLPVRNPLPVVRKKKVNGPCEFEGKSVLGPERQRLGLDHNRPWRYCLNLEKPLGDAVCSCRGCGPTCRGYKSTAEEEAPFLPGDSTDVTLVIPHRNTPDWLDITHAIWRALYPELPILIIDNSPDTDAAAAYVRQLRQRPLTEVAWMAPTWPRAHPFEEVSSAMDYAFSRCETTYLLAAHSDMFPLRGDIIAMMRVRCKATTPIVGWEMSRRPPNGDRDFAAGVVGHVCSLYHMPTMRRIGAAWGVGRYVQLSGDQRREAGWPDVECGVGWAMRQAGLKPAILGKEENDSNQQTEWWLHSRSTSIHRNFPEWGGEGSDKRHRDGLERGREFLATLTNRQ
jgi:hypothetical protein